MGFYKIYRKVYNEKQKVTGKRKIFTMRGKK